MCLPCAPLQNAHKTDTNPVVLYLAIRLSSYNFKHLLPLNRKPWDSRVSMYCLKVISLGPEKISLKNHISFELNVESWTKKAKNEQLLNETTTNNSCNRWRCNSLKIFWGNFSRLSIPFFFVNYFCLHIKLSILIAISF